MDNKLDKAPALLTTIGGLCMIATGLVGLGLMVAVLGRRGSGGLTADTLRYEHLPDKV
jgi:hypothetical protein